MTSDVTLTDAQRLCAYRLSEALIPPQPGEISIDEAGVPAIFLDRVLVARPDLIDDFKFVLDSSVESDARLFCEDLQRSDQRLFGVLTFVTGAAYFMSPRVRERLKYSGQVGEFQNGAPQPEYQSGGLLDDVLKRGRIYRPAMEVGTREPPHESVGTL